METIFFFLLWDTVSSFMSWFDLMETKITWKWFFPAGNTFQYCSLPFPVRFHFIPISLNTSIAFCSLSIYEHASGFPKFLLISLLMFLYNFMPDLFQQAQGIFSNTLKKIFLNFKLAKCIVQQGIFSPRLAIHFIWCSSC